MEKELLYKIAIGLIPGMGPITTKKLIAYTGSLEGVFREKKQLLLKIPGIGPQNLQKLDFKTSLCQAEEELKFIYNNHIKTLFYLDQEYPQRLLQCQDAPITLYYKGETDLNATHILSIVGTRNASDYGRNLCNTLISDIVQKGHTPLIVSGLAYGIDIEAHKSAIKNQLPTLAVFGTGLNTIYPAQHRKYIPEIIYNGAIITEFTSQTPMDPKNFVRRNRIIAGISDATIVIESAKKGGSLITAEIANSYNREVLAFPGRINDHYSSGCNHLIKTNQAHLIEGISDVEYLLNWQTNSKPTPKQPLLFSEHTVEEKMILDTLNTQTPLPIDIICIKTTLPMNRVSTLLLKLEFEGLISALPGKIYSLKA